MPRLNPSDRLRDAFYTPDALANEVLAAATNTPTSVMDPAVGDGSLLRAATATWPGVRILGLDVDRGQIARNRASHPDWTLGQVDMFSDRSRAASAVWRSTRASIDLMLLNPPFSYRGGQSKHLAYEGSEYALTPASAFIAHAITRLAPDGELLALLPAGVLALERDAKFWSALAMRWTVETVAEFSSTAFSGTRTRSVLVAVRPQVASQPAAILDLPLRAHTCLELVRGRVPVHALTQILPTGASAPFLHTRDLADLSGRVATVSRASASLATPGPFVTLPRVGRVRGEHIKLVRSPHAVVLSDCVFALRTGNTQGHADLQATLLESLPELQREYVGGCAPYLTIRRLQYFLGQRGYCCHHVPASSSVSLSSDTTCNSVGAETRRVAGVSD